MRLPHRLAQVLGYEDPPAAKSEKEAASALYNEGYTNEQGYTIKPSSAILGIGPIDRDNDQYRIPTTDH